MAAYINADVSSQIAAQADREQMASNIYMELSLWAANQGYSNMATWFKTASAEELEHRNKMLEFLFDMGCACQFGGTKATSGEMPASPIEAFQSVLELEVQVSGYIHKIASLCMSKNDWHSFTFIQFFLNEQLDSVREVTNIVARARNAQGNWLEFDDSLEA